MFFLIDILKSPLNLQNNFNSHNFTTVCNGKMHSSVDCPMSWSNFGHVSLLLKYIHSLDYY